MKRYYLLTYNLLLAIGWAVFLAYQITHGFELDGFSLLLLNICQIAAVLEIVHAVSGIVSTPATTAAIQVSSRIFVLYWINVLAPDAHLSVMGIDGIVMVSIAWGITEVVRYSLYFTQLLPHEVKLLTYLRYTLFIILYPLGVTGEWFILLSKVVQLNWEVSLLLVLLIVVLLSYLPLFPKLYGYMFSQRKKKLV